MRNAFATFPQGVHSSKIAEPVLLPPHFPRDEKFWVQREFRYKSRWRMYLRPAPGGQRGRAYTSLAPPQTGRVESGLARHGEFNMRRLLLAVACLVLVLAAMIGSAPAQTYTLLYNFGSGNSGNPNCPQFSGIVAQGRSGDFFSTSPDCWTDELGTAFSITSTGTLTVLHSFNGTDGQGGHSGLTLGTDGKFYGTTALGGLYGNGTIFKITANGVMTTLYNFTGGHDGGQPGAPPIEGSDGNFYGTTTMGGSVGNTGTVYKLTPSGTFTTLHRFPYLAGTIGYPYGNGALVQGSDGRLYGSTFYGGSQSCDGFGCGTIFRISHSGNFKTLHNFDGTHGANSYGPLIEGSDGNFYGVASNGGSVSGQTGVVFKMTPAGAFTVLHNFTLASDGGNEVGGLMQATDGNFYGTNNLAGTNGWGILFRITPKGAFTVLHNFDWGSGASPQATMVQHTNGVLYGTTKVGGDPGGGAFYSFDVGLGPFVRFLPAARKVGAWVEFLGQGFTGTTAVSFNGTLATLFTVNSDTYLTAKVPVGATTGFVTVTTPGGTLTSNKKFVVTR